MSDNADKIRAVMMQHLAFGMACQHTPELMSWRDSKNPEVWVIQNNEIGRWVERDFAGMLVMSEIINQVIEMRDEALAPLETADEV